MKTITIIRHAKSSWDYPELPDVIRPLNKRGIDAAGQVGRYLAKLHEKPDLIISSPATRAYHTAVCVAQILGYRLKNIHVEPTVYFEGEQGILNLLREQNNLNEHIFIFGHEPTCSDLINTLTGESISKFATASVCKIALDIKDWKDIYQASSKKVFLIGPKQVKD
jgi:phosphohistidine phosphatase